MSEEADAFGVNRRIADRYRILWQIGQGGMGTVYAALDEKLARPVALKVLLNTHRQDEEAVARFEREAVATAAIRHPGIVQIFDQGREGMATFVVMERLEGEDLGALIDREAPVAVPRVARLGGDLADALAAAHAASVIHRDLKPANVFLVRSGLRTEVVKILDFGIAKMALAAQTLTRTNQVFGTLRYMSPEQVTNSKDVGPATDVFALGTILYEMLTARAPHEGRSKVEVTYQILNDLPVAPQQHRSSIPGTLNALILSCLAKKPGKRPKAEEVASALNGLGANQRAPSSIVFLPPPIVVTDKSRPIPAARLENSTLRLGGEATEGADVAAERLSTDGK